jgi:putative membrane protein
VTESSAVRDHLANERTQLAWLRTSANVVVVGLAVARFAAVVLLVGA